MAYAKPADTTLTSSTTTALVPYAEVCQSDWTVLHVHPSHRLEVLVIVPFFVDHALDPPSLLVCHGPGAREGLERSRGAWPMDAGMLGDAL